MTEPAPAVETPTAYQQIVDSVDPCPSCNAPFEPLTCEEGFPPRPMAEHECQAILDSWEAHPDTRRLVTAFRFYCAKCNRLTEEARKLAVRAKRIERKMIDAVNQGLFPQSAMMQTFAQSRRDIEQRNPHEFRWARRWRGLNDENVWILGSEGTGKTYLGRAMANEALTVYEASIAELKTVEMSHAAQRFDADAWIRPYKEVQVLLIEDIDKIARDDKSVMLLWGVINARNDNRLRTIVTTNMSPEAFKKMIRAVRADNPSVADTLLARLNWPGIQCKRLELKGTSLRREKATEEGASHD